MHIPDVAAAMERAAMRGTVPAGFTVTCTREGIHWTTPDERSSWSAHRGERGACVIEGDFYRRVSSHGAPGGDDKSVAASVLDRVLERGIEALDELNGVFAGAIYLQASRRLLLFVDRLGVRLLYYRASGHRCEGATSIYSLRDGAKLDPQALNEHLVIGFPLDSRTLFTTIALVPPGSVVEWSPTAGVRVVRYATVPQRLSGQRLADAASMICETLDRHVVDTPDEPCSIALSGGRDSRVILASLLRGGRRPVALTFGATEDSRNAQRLAAITGISSTTLEAVDPSAFDTDSALVSDGYTLGWGYLGLSAVATLIDRPLVFTGFAGDYLSGSWGPLKPWKARSTDELAAMELKIRGTEVAPELVRSCLAPDYRVPYGDVEAAFAESYRETHSTLPDMVATYLVHRTANRIRRRIVPLFNSMRWLSRPRHPFADRDVVTTYLSLPLSAIDAQAAHSLAASQGHRGLGRIPIGAAWLPLAYERHAVRLLKPLRRRWSPGVPPPRWWSGSRRQLSIACESPLFDASALMSRADDPALVAAVGKLAATAIHVAAMTRTTLPSAREALIVREPHRIGSA